MNFLLVLYVLLLLLSLTDFMLYNQERFHSSMFKIAWFLAFVFFSIKYYYGPDIEWYVPLYEHIPTLSMLLSGTPINSSYEVGFNYFMVFCKSLGLSYWGMTFVVNILYFSAIYSLFKQLNVRSVLMIFLLVILDYNLLMAQHRQCLSVSFFIYMFLAYHKRHFIWMTLFLILSMVMHKAGIFCAFISYFLLLLHFRANSQSYQFLSVLALLFLFIPIHYCFLFFAEVFSLDPMIIHSLEFHFSYIKKIQTILLFYIIVYYCYSVYTNKPLIYQQMNAISFVGVFFIAIFYSYFPILGRVRAYYTPFILAFIFYALQNQLDTTKVKVLGTINNQFFKAIHGLIYFMLFVYATYSIHISYKSQNAFESKIYDSSTVFDLIHSTRDEIRERQLKKSNYYWNNELQDQIENFKIEN